MSALSAVKAARVYVEVGAADAFARRLLLAHGVPDADAATVAACLVGADLRGVDMVLVGLNDLLADWGIPGEYDHPRVREAYAKTIAACRKRGKHCGVGGLATRPDLVAEFVKMGARYVSTGTDLAFLLSACTARAKEVKEIKL